jgi:ABC-type lipopolysaccharide export system ATPase subunit
MFRQLVPYGLAGQLIADDVPKEVVNNPQVLKAYLGDRSWDFAYNN